MIMDPGYMLLDSGSWLQVSGSGTHGICSRFICFDRNQQHSNASPNNIKTATFWHREYHLVMMAFDWCVDPTSWTRTSLHLIDVLIHGEECSISHIEVSSDDDDEDDDELGSPWEYAHMWKQGCVLFMKGMLVNLCMVYVREQLLGQLGDPISKILACKKTLS